MTAGDGNVIRFPVERRIVAAAEDLAERCSLAQLRPVMEHVYTGAFRRVMGGEGWDEAFAAAAEPVLRVLEGGDDLPGRAGALPRRGPGRGLSLVQRHGRR